MLSLRRFAFLLGMALSGAVTVPGQVASRGALTLAQVLDSALARSPEVAAARHEAEAREGEVLQAGLPDNPELGLELENFAGRGAFAEADRELTASLSQTLDLGRLAHRSVAERESEEARLELESLILRVRAGVRRHFVAVQAGQDRIALSAERVSLARRAHTAAAEKVAAGKAPPTDSLHSFMALAEARIDSGRAAHSLGAARRDLALASGLTEAASASVTGSLDLARSVPDWEEVSKRIPASPAGRRIALMASMREAELRREKLARLPPITLAAGIRQVPDKDGRAYVAGVSMPIPAWNRNQGSIRAARHRRLKADAEGNAARAGTTAHLAALHAQASASHREAVLLRDQILPAAQAAFEGAQEAYRLGKYGSPEALDAQHTLFEAQARYIDALEALHVALAELEESLGGPVLSGGNHPG